MNSSPKAIPLRVYYRKWFRNNKKTRDEEFDEGHLAEPGISDTRTGQLIRVCINKYSETREACDVFSSSSCLGWANLVSREVLLELSS